MTLKPSPVYVATGTTGIENPDAGIPTTIFTPLLAICPGCKVDIHGSLGPEEPRPGFITVCGECGILGCFDEQLQMRILTNAEWASLSQDARVSITAMREFILACWKEQEEGQVP